jgi:hypothetical protein
MPRMQARGKMPCSTLYYAPEQLRERESEEKIQEERSYGEEKGSRSREVMEATFRSNLKKLKHIGLKFQVHEKE